MSKVPSLSTNASSLILSINVGRLLDEPRPKIVGIGWVVACAEKREQVDEERYKVNIDNINVAGTLKVRLKI